MMFIKAVMRALIVIAAAFAINSIIPPSAASANQPPRELFLHITSTSQLVHQGECKVDSLRIGPTPCMIFAGDVLWIVLFDDADTAAPQVTQIVKAAGDVETVAWCREDLKCN